VALVSELQRLPGCLRADAGHARHRSVAFCIGQRGPRVADRSDPRPARASMRDSRSIALLLATTVGICGLAVAGPTQAGAVPRGAVAASGAAGLPSKGIVAPPSVSAASNGPAEEAGRIRTQVISLHDVTISGE